MLHVIILSKQGRFRQQLKDILSKEKVTDMHFYEDITKLSHKNHACNLLIINDFEDIPISSYIQLQQRFSCIILLIASMRDKHEQQQLSDQGIFLCFKPVKKAFLQQMIHMCLVLHHQYEQVVKRYDDLKIIHQAKCLLMEHQHYKEAQAHRHIEKQAMDARCSKVMIAKKIIQYYKKECTKNV